MSLALLAVTAATAPGAGTWTPLTRNAPGPVALMLLLSDGTVMAANNSNTIGNAWYRLTPDSHGSYLNGTWSTLAPMHDTRLWYSSAVLKDGRVFVAGGEYGTGTATSEVYDPASNTWTTIPIPIALLNPALTSPSAAEPQGFYDSCSKITANGNVLVTPVAPATYGGTLIFNATLNSWSAGPTLFRGAYQAEASWAKLPDNTILTVDPFGVNSERYNPVTNAWINDGVLPVSLYDSSLRETGAALRLADGRVFFLGGTGHTALYTPSGTTVPGAWAAGPDIPANLATPDAPAAMMVSGKILCAVGPKAYIDANNFPVFPAPTTFYEYDPTTNAFTSVNAPVGASDNIPPYATLMLALPDGNILYSHFGADLYLYQPDGAPLAAGKPSITSVTSNPDGSFHLIGAGLNGISEGAAYGDDAQMDTNYPIVRFTESGGGTGLVYYARTYNWSSTGVATGATPVTTEFRPPVNLPPGQFNLFVVANGIASDPFPFSFTGTIAIAGAGSNTIADSTANGNSNGRIDPGETDIRVFVPLRNNGTATATNVSAILTSSTPTATVVSNASLYPNLPPTSGPIQNLSSYALSISPSHPCGAPISLTLAVSSDSGPVSYSFSLPTGSAGPTSGPFAFAYAGVPVAIPDNSPAGVTIPLTVSGLTGTISNIKFRFTGSACTANAGATTVGLDHTWIGDVTVTLRSPSGTVVQLVNRPGGENNFGHNFCGTTLDDLAPSPIQAIVPSGNPWSGSFSPSSPLSALNGENPNGTWQLFATDSFPGDTGSIRGFSLIISTAQPATCDPPGACVPVNVTGSPTSRTTCPGTMVTLAVTATGTPPISYQWRKNMATITGATAASFSLPSAQPSDSGSYDCIVTNNCGTAPSTPATLSICAADFTCSDGLTVQDIFDFLNAWFAASPRADFNADGHLNTGDIFSFLGAWFAGC
jgi:subtilisin-like proprotein convertase family protein